MTQSSSATSQPPADRRLLLVHAHPDDETLTTGVTMAKYAAEGVAVTLVTCTLGEEGEVLLPDLAHLAADQHDLLGPHRREELAAAMSILGIDDHRRLGGDGHYRDSGMVGTPANNRPDCFWRADLLDAAALLVPIIRDVRPQVVITYDDFGGYGHPDHIQAHRVTTYAVALAAAPGYAPEAGAPWEVPKMYWPAIPRSLVIDALSQLDEEQRATFLGDFDPLTAPFLVDDELITTRIDGVPFVAAKREAMMAHATQIDMDSPFIAMSALGGPEALGHEFYRIAKGPVVTEGRYEEDLFAGL
jgi:N-acetyl-1-D-myo-inositol-2-amino-2-deoxy-alpha-D-glucopyranoside deacetylase